MLVIRSSPTIKHKPSTVMRTPHQILNGVGAAFFAAGSGLGGEQAEKQAVQLPVEYGTL